MDLVQFLRDRLDEEEGIARAATQGEWVWSREFVTPPGYHHRTIGPLEPGDAAHIAAHDPARVLRNVEAKRGIVDDLAEVIRWGERKGPDYQDGVDACERTLKRLALPYADHPGFREEWRL